MPEKKYMCPCCGKDLPKDGVCTDCPAQAIEKK